MMARSAAAERAAVSNAASWGALPETTTGASDARSPAQAEADPCGSRSTKAVVRPACSPATASPHARVVLPAPPFRLMRATVYMASQTSTVS